MTELEQTVIDLYATGLSIWQVVGECRISHRRATKILRANNILIRTSRRKYTLNEHVFDVIDNELAAYWYGFLYADGCVRKTFLQVILAIKDIDHLKEFAEFMQSSSPVSPKVNVPHPRCHFVIFSEHLTNRLRDMGITPNRPNPQRILDNVPAPLFNHWLRGFFDGDGCADKRKSIWFCGDIELLDIIRNVLACEASRNKDHTISKHQTAKLHYLRYKGYYNAHAVSGYMYQRATFWMQRKLDVINSWKEPLSHPDRAKLGWEKRRTHPCRKNQYA